MLPKMPDMTDSVAPTAGSYMGGADLSRALGRAGIPMLLWAAALCYLVLSLPLLRGRALRGDFPVYYLSSRAFYDGANPYRANFDRLAARLGLDNGMIKQATDPPSFIILFAPFSRLSAPAAFWTWSALMLAALIASAIILLRQSGLPLPWQWSIGAIVALYPPVTNHFIYGQNKILILLMLVLAMRAIALKSDGVAGLMIAMAALMRMFPLLLIGYLLLRRLRGAFWFTLGWLMVGGLLTVLIFGLGNTLGFAHAVGYLTRQRWLTEHGNISLDGFIDRVFASLGTAVISRRGEVWRELTIGFCNLAIVAAIVRATLARPAIEDPDSRIFALWVAAAVLLSPTAWFHYLTIMLIPFIGIAGAHDQGSIGGRGWWTMMLSLGFSIAFIGYGANPYTRAIGAPLLYESGFLALLTGFISAYWFAVDGAELPPWRMILRLSWNRIFAREIATTPALQS